MIDEVEILYYRVDDQFITCNACDSNFDLIDLSIRPDILRRHAKDHKAHTMILTKIIHIQEVNNDPNA